MRRSVVVVLVALGVRAILVVMLVLVTVAIVAMVVLVFGCVLIAVMMMLMLGRVRVRAVMMRMLVGVLVVTAMMMGVLISMFVARDSRRRAKRKRAGRQGEKRGFVSHSLHGWFSFGGLPDNNSADLRTLHAEIPLR